MKEYAVSPEQMEKIKTALRSQGALIGYLFGSRARGTAGALSDVDIGAAFPRTIPLQEQENRIENIRAKLENIFGRDKVDVINVGAVRDPLLRYRIVLGEGMLLFADVAALKNSIARRALRDFEDTRRLREIQHRVAERIFA
ncbi:MAG: nucleotidyltransferase domain-containing protein [Patescibacteria group bacterium]